MPDRSDLLKQALTLSKKATTEQDLSESITILTTCIQSKPDHPQLYAQRAKCYLSLSQYQRALFDFSMAIRLDPNTGRHFAARAACFKRLGRVAEAIRDFSEAIRCDSSSAAFFFDRALVSYDQRDFNAAISDFSAALDRKFPEPVKLLLLRGVAFRELGKFAEAVGDLRQAVAVDPGNAECFDQLGVSLAGSVPATDSPTAHVASAANPPSSTGTLSEAHTVLTQAIAAYTSAIEINNSNSQFYFHRGLGYYKLHDFGAATADFSKALAIKAVQDANEGTATAGSGEVWFWRGNSYMSEKNNRNALSDFEEAISREPKKAVYHHHRGLVLEMMGEVRAAIQAFEVALKCDPEFVAAKFHLAVVFHLDGQTTRALELLADFDDAGNGEFFERRGLILLDLRRFRESLRDFDLALEVASAGERRAQLRLSRGRVLSRMGEYRFAMEDFDAALDTAKEDGIRAEAFWERGRTKVKENDLNGAISDFTRAIDLAGDRKSEYFLNRAETYIAMGLYELAETDLEKSEESEFLYKRGLVRYALKKYAWAVKDFETALELSVRPSCMADLLYHLGVCLANCDQHTPAVEAYSRAIEREVHVRPHYYHERAKSLQEVGRHKEAVEDFSRVIGWQPRNARAYFRRAFSYKALKHFEEAADDFETAKNLDHHEDPRLSVNYRKISTVPCVSLGPCGFEDTYYAKSSCCRL